MSIEKIVFVVNPVSGTRNKERITRLILEKTKNHFKPVIKYTRYPGHATKIASKQVEKGIKTVVAVGGDGTVNEVASGLINSETTLGIIPTGSGNGLARHLQIPLNISQALEVIFSQLSIRIDYGKINDSCFFCTCGVGFDARIGGKFAESEKRGFTTYVKTTVKEFFSYKPKTYRLKTGENKIKKKAFLITFANASQYGNNAYISPNANIRDGLMDICIIAPFPKIRAAGLGIRLFGKTMDKSNYVKVLRASEVTLKRKKPGEVHFDGEPAYMGKKLKIKIIHQGLKVYVQNKKIH
ncbi:MAG TPA: diacylglycerol kinase family protein [Bacteroidales bacterium]|nr:diacylglycerol kinase family protein [Bacteroidales bacterium]